MKKEMSLHQRQKHIILFLSFLSLLFVARVWIQFKEINQWQLPDSLIQKPIVIAGVIESIPNYQKHFSKFQFVLQEFNGHSAHSIILLSWYQHPPILHVGERWQFLVKLKPRVGLHNPGGFDYANWLFFQGISATGYVIGLSDQNKLTGIADGYMISRMRGQIQTVIAQSVSNHSIASILSALSVGLRDGMTTADWRVFQNTGTNHLVVIAGLHIGMLASLVYQLVYRVYCLFPALLLRIQAIRIAKCGAIVVTLIYASLSGFAVPAERAMIMILCAMCSELMHRQIPVWQRFLIAIFLIEMIDPFSIATASFWLSFAAVGSLAYVSCARLSFHSNWFAWWRMQLSLWIALIPFTLWYFHQISLISLLTNTIAIPWIGFIVVPFALMGTFLWIGKMPIMSHWFFQWSGCILSPLWKILTWFSNLHDAVWIHVIPTQVILIALIITSLLLLLPNGMPLRWVSCFGFLLLFFAHPEKPLQNEFSATVLDVGEGLSVVVETLHHTLVYDTGPHAFGGFDAGESVVAPFLYRRYITHIDRLMISHGDNDHSGGAAYLVSTFPIDEIDTSAPQLISQFHARYCQKGQSWVWDGVRFDVLNPTDLSTYEDNNSSCVLRISTGTSSLLLTGDIEKSQEKLLAAHDPSSLHATVLVSPHHGSRTSSSEIFMQAVLPHYAIISNGLYNRYHFPSKIVLERYQQFHAKVYNTAIHGAINIRFRASGQVILTPKLNK